MYPSELITKPDPRALTVLSFELSCFGALNGKLKKSSNDGAVCCLCLTMLVVDILTTEGDNFSAKFEKVSGASNANAKLLLII